MEEFKDRMFKFMKCLEENKDDFEVPILSDLLIENKVRIHDNGLDSQGVRIGLKADRVGKYTPAYEKKKRERFRKVYPINLFFQGDLSRSQEVGKDGDDNVLLFNINITYNGLTSAELAKRHEEVYNTEIFTPNSEVVLEAINRVGRTVLTEFLSKCAGAAGFVVSGNLDDI